MSPFPALIALTLLAGCAHEPPQELVDARAAYEAARVGPAATMAPTDLRKARDALAAAEESYVDAPRSYKTKDLAYVAERASEKATAVGQLAMEQQKTARAEAEYSTLQATIEKEPKETKETTAATETAGTADRKVATETRAEDGKATLRDEKTTLPVDKTAVPPDKATFPPDKTDTGERPAEDDATKVAHDTKIVDAQRAEADAKLAKMSKTEPRGVVITVSDSGLFRAGQATLTADGVHKLDEIASVLLVNKGRELLVEGHTDSVGDAAFNLELSRRRANTVRTYLIERGYEAGLIRAVGVGEVRPITDNTTFDGRDANARVEIIILK